MDDPTYESQPSDHPAVETEPPSAFTWMLAKREIDRVKAALGPLFDTDTHYYSIGQLAEMAAAERDVFRARIDATYTELTRGGQTDGDRRRAATAALLGEGESREVSA